jgi:hypothetical protein
MSFGLTLFLMLRASTKDMIATNLLRVLSSKHKALLKPCHPFLVAFETQPKKRWVVLHQLGDTSVIKKQSVSKLNKSRLKQESARGSFLCLTQATFSLQSACIQVGASIAKLWLLTMASVHATV